MSDEIVVRKRADSVDSFQDVSSETKTPEPIRILKVNDKVPEVLHVLKYLGLYDNVLEYHQSLTPFARIPPCKVKTSTSGVEIDNYGDGDDEKPVIEIVYKVLRDNADPPYRHHNRGRNDDRPITSAFDLNDYRYDDLDTDDETDAATAAAPKPTINMNIHSKYLIYALQAVMGYYLRVNLNGNPISIPPPYRVLYLHRAELAHYRDNQPKSHSPEFAAITARHIDVLLGFLDEHLGKDLKNELALHAMDYPSATFDLFWLLLKPGQIIYAKRFDIWTPFVVSSIKAGSSRNFKMYKVHCWFLESNGVTIKRFMETFRVEPWTGEQLISSLPVIPEAFWIDDLAAQGGRTMRQKCIEEGRLYWELLRKPTYMEYDGQLVNPAATNSQAAGNIGKLCGRVICDPVGFDRYYTQAPDYNSRPGLNSSRQGNPMPPPLDHLPRSRPRCSCDACNDSRDPSQFNDGLFAEFVDRDPTKDAAPGSELYYQVLSNTIPGFVLGTRRWAALDISCLKPVISDKNAFKDLVLDEEIKMTVKALIGKFSAGPNAELRPWSTDIVQNKGEGRILLLHGTPGVGKTCTAETISELANRPLISITSGDLGTESYRVESSLNYFLELGQRYGALLLLDEADVYLERRRSKDITRNGLVSTFLRALEYYRGVLFLTTNRVQAFDSAFLSRIHVSLHYKNLRDEDRERIWANKIDRVERESHGAVRISTAARSLLLGNNSGDHAIERLRGLKWNGREIRNALQTMLALAEAEAQEEGSKVVTVGQKHVSAVINMSGEFRDYIKKTTPIAGIQDVEVEGDLSD